MLLKRKSNNLVKNLSATLQVEIDPLENKIGVHETLVNLTAWHDSLTSNHVLHLWPFRELLLASYSRASHAQILLIHLLKLNSSPISHTYPLQINPHTYKKND